MRVAALDASATQSDGRVFSYGRRRRLAGCSKAASTSSPRRIPRFLTGGRSDGAPLATLIERAKRAGPGYKPCRVDLHGVREWHGKSVARGRYDLPHQLELCRQSPLGSFCFAECRRCSERPTGEASVGSSPAGIRVSAGSPGRDCRSCHIRQRSTDRVADGPRGRMPFGKPVAGFPRSDALPVGDRESHAGLTRPLGNDRHARARRVGLTRRGGSGAADGGLGRRGIADVRLGSESVNRPHRPNPGNAMELRHLRYFVAVAEELHFRRAAERLHVAQPAISEQVRKLEQELGVTLLERTPRSVLLTEAGAALLEDAKHVLRMADAAQQSARNAHDRATGRLRIGYVAAALPAAVPRALQAVRSRASHIETTLEAGGAVALIEAVRDERLDVAVVPLPAPATGLRVTRLTDQHAVAALPLTHPNASLASLSFEKVAPERLIVLPREVNRPFYDGIIAACRAARLAPTLRELPDGDVEQGLLAVASGAGMAVLPESIAERFATPGVRFVPVADPHPGFSPGVVTRRYSDHVPTASFLRILSRTVEPLRPIPLPEPPPAVAAA
jgi:DNA-binding transcriptional LysR family regulator